MMNIAQNISTSIIAAKNAKAYVPVLATALKVYVNLFAEISINGKCTAVVTVGVFLGHVRRVKWERIAKI